VGTRLGDMLISAEMKLATAVGMDDGSASRYVLKRWFSSHDLVLGGRKCGQQAREKMSSMGPKGIDDKEEARMSSRHAVKYFAKRPPMAVEAEAKMASAKRWWVKVQERVCWMVCNKMGLLQTSSTCSKMKSCSSKSKQN